MPRFRFSFLIPVLLTAAAIPTHGATTHGADAAPSTTARTTPASRSRCSSTWRTAPTGAPAPVIGGQELPWVGPTVNPVYFAPDSPHAVPGYAPKPGDDRIKPAMTGTLTIDDRGTPDGSDDLISGTAGRGPGGAQRGEQHQFPGRPAAAPRGEVAGHPPHARADRGQLRHPQRRRRLRLRDRQARLPHPPLPQGRSGRLLHQRTRAKDHRRPVRRGRLGRPAGRRHRRGARPRVGRRQPRRDHHRGVRGLLLRRRVRGQGMPARQRRLGQRQGGPRPRQPAAQGQHRQPAAHP